MGYDKSNNPARWSFPRMRWFDRFDKLTAGRLTILPALSRVEGSSVEGESRLSMPHTPWMPASAGMTKKTLPAG